MSAQYRDSRQLVEELVGVASVSGEETACADVLVDYFESAGRVVWIDEVGNVRAAGDDSVLLTSHMDTVPGHIPVRVEDDVLHGRGSVDAKGALAAMAVAAAQTGASFVGVVGEEADSRGARHLVSDRDPPETLINGEPSGWDGITLAYRGLLGARYSRTSEAMHSARPQNNAIEDALGWWRRVSDSFGAADTDAVMTQVTPKPVGIAGGPSDDGRTVEASLDVEFRIPVERSIDHVRQRVEAQLVDGSIDWAGAIPPVQQSQRTPVARAFRSAIRAAGGDPRPLEKTGTSDMNIFATLWECPMVTYGPGDSALDHTPNERLPLPAYDRSIEVLTDVCSTLIDP